MGLDKTIFKNIACLHKSSESTENNVVPFPDLFWHFYSLKAVEKCRTPDAAVASLKQAPKKRKKEKITWVNVRVSRLGITSEHKSLEG